MAHQVSPSDQPSVHLSTWNHLLQGASTHPWKGWLCIFTLAKCSKNSQSWIFLYGTSRPFFMINARRITFIWREHSNSKQIKFSYEDDCYQHTAPASLASKFNLFAISVLHHNRNRPPAWRIRECNVGTLVRPSKTHLDFLISREKLQAAEVLFARHHIQPNLPDSQPQAVLAGQVAASYHSQPFEAPPSPSTAAGSKITCLPCQCYTPPHLNIKNENMWNPPPPFPINPLHERPLWQKRNT